MVCAARPPLASSLNFTCCSYRRRYYRGTASTAAATADAVAMPSSQTKGGGSREREERKEAALPVEWPFNQAKLGRERQQNERSREIANPSKVTAEAEPHLSYLFLHSTIDKEERRQYTSPSARRGKAPSSHSIFTSSQLLSPVFACENTHTDAHFCFLSSSFFVTDHNGAASTAQASREEAKKQKVWERETHCCTCISRRL